jgi:peptidoglycan/xylan/chitin deacetylase (PgdA/CDA1 family)
MEMKNKDLSRRKFIVRSSVTILGSTLGFTLINASRWDTLKKIKDRSEIDHLNPGMEAGCVVALGYDVDMPYGGNDYLYAKDLPWKGRDGLDAHGHLNEDIREYIEKLATIAETFDSKLQFFIQGNTFEVPEDVSLWRNIAGRGHAIDSHMYNHDNLLMLKPEEVRSQLTRTKKLIDAELGTENTGLRGPGGYGNGLNGRGDIQQAVLDAGIKWASTRFEFGEPGNDLSWVKMIPKQQPYFYDSGLLEIPFCGHQDRSYFDPDIRGGDPGKTHDDWIAYLKQCVDIAYEQNLFLSLTVHPSTSFKHDPKARYVTKLLEYCRQKPDIRICTYRDIYSSINK